MCRGWSGRCAGFDVEVVVAVLESQRELFTEMPANVRSVGPVPLHLLLPTCDAIIHQGGGGTLMTALVCGVPQLVVPSIPDQTFNARQLAATGAGRYLPGGEAVTEAAVAEHAGSVLDDAECRDAARQLQAEALALPAPADVVGVLSSWPAPEPARPATALNRAGRETQMRVLFATWAFSGHLNPMVPLGWALRAAGHETLVASHPSFAPVIARAGLPALPVGPEFDLDAEVRAETMRRALV